MASARSMPRAGKPGRGEGTIVGTKLGSYRVIARLGVAGSEAVYLARHVALDREAVVEVVRGGPGGAERGDGFLEAAQALARIAHPGLVEVLDCGFTADGKPYLVRERLDGESVAARVEREGYFDEEEAARLVAQAASALAAAHACGVTHGALVAERVLLVADPERPGRDRAKVVGFGREAQRGRRTSAREDVAALGAVLAGMVSMRPPPAAPPPARPGRGGERRITVPRPASRPRPAPAGPDLMRVLRRMLDPTGEGAASMDEIRRLLSGPPWRPGPIAASSGPARGAARIDAFLGPSGERPRRVDPLQRPASSRPDAPPPEDSAPTTRMAAASASASPTLAHDRASPRTIELPTTKMPPRPAPSGPRDGRLRLRVDQPSQRPSQLATAVPLEAELRRPRFWLLVALVTVATAALFLALASVALRLVT